LAFRLLHGGTKHVFRVNLAPVSSAIPEILAENPVFVPGDLDLWPRHSNSSEQGTKHVFPAIFAQIRSVVQRYFMHKQKSHRQRQKQNLTQFAACCY